MYLHGDEEGGIGDSPWWMDVEERAGGRNENFYGGPEAKIGSGKQGQRCGQSNADLFRTRRSASPPPAPLPPWQTSTPPSNSTSPFPTNPSPTPPPPSLSALGSTPSHQHLPRVRLTRFPNHLQGPHTPRPDKPSSVDMSPRTMPRTTAARGVIQR